MHPVTASMLFTKLFFTWIVYFYFMFIYFYYPILRLSYEVRSTITPSYCTLSMLTYLYSSISPIFLNLLSTPLILSVASSLWSCYTQFITLSPLYIKCLLFFSGSVSLLLVSWLKHTSTCIHIHKKTLESRVCICDKTFSVCLSDQGCFT